jgi:hypothetical protein
VLSVYRNWDENDDAQESLVHIVEWPFLPWRGAMPIGAPQVLGGIAAATTGSLRALLDSALINNFPGGVRLKSGPVGGQSVRVEGGQTSEIDGGIMQDDIRKTFMPTPVNPTSQVLLELMQFLVESGKEVVKTTLDEANDNANVPVGTIMARIEQQMVVFSAIHSRLHNAMGKALKVIHRLNATYLEDEDVLNKTGEQMAWKEDFDAPDDVVPVSDPEIFSELQRVAQIQTIAQRAQIFPQLYDGYAVESDILKMMKVPNPEKYLVPKPEPKPLNAINENIAASLGQPVVAFPDQDHLAHIQSHLNFLTDPIYGANPLMAGQAIGALLQNVKEHMLFWYGMEVHRIATEAAGRGHHAVHDHQGRRGQDGAGSAPGCGYEPCTPGEYAGVRQAPSDHPESSGDAQAVHPSAAYGPERGRAAEGAGRRAIGSGQAPAGGYAERPGERHQAGPAAARRAAWNRPDPERPRQQRHGRHYEGGSRSGYNSGQAPGRSGNERHQTDRNCRGQQHRRRDRRRRDRGRQEDADQRRHCGKKPSEE